MNNHKKQLDKELTQERLKELLDYNPDIGIFTWKVNKTQSIKVGDVAGYLRVNGYIRIMVEGKRYYAHRLAWFYIYGRFPKDEIDHVNHSPRDNRISNLREVSHVENSHNQIIRNNNTSGIAGVCWHKLARKWMAYIKVNKGQKYLGLFNSIELAKEAREEAKIKYNYHLNHA